MLSDILCGPDYRDMTPDRSHYRRRMSQRGFIAASLSDAPRLYHMLNKSQTRRKSSLVSG
jgi:hypothetical protein